MSVKFQETTQTKVTEAASGMASAAAGAAKAATEKREDLTHRVGEFLTGGDTGKGYLAVGRHSTWMLARLTITSKIANVQRPISNNCRQILFEQRCSLPAH